MAFDFKKEYPEFYLPKAKPEVVTVPTMHFVAVRGRGNPNEPEGAYQHAMNLLYGVAFTVKMSKLSDHRMDGYFDYVVPPLEGFWWQDGVDGIDYAHKEDFRWISVIRLPDFVTKAEFDWAVQQAEKKKKQDYSGAEFLSLEEGLCVQCMHVGAYDDEPETIGRMEEFLRGKGYENDFTPSRLHHEIYLSDARKVPACKCRTVLRHPIRKGTANK